MGMGIGDWGLAVRMLIEDLTVYLSSLSLIHISRFHLISNRSECISNFFLW